MTRSGLALSLMAVMSLPLTARADLITGVVNFTGAANISLGSIAFEGNVISLTSPAATQQGGFTALAGTAGTILNLMDPPDAAGPVNLPDFITFAAAPDISMTLTYLYPGVYGSAGCTAGPAAAGQLCTPDTPDLSPFNLVNTSSKSSTASFNVLGFEVDSSSGNTVPVFGTFSTPFSSQSFQDLLAVIAGGGTITTSFSAQLSTVAAPEPGTLIEFMIGIGVVGIGLVCRKRFGNPGINPIRLG